MVAQICLFAEDDSPQKWLPRTSTEAGGGVRYYRVYRPTQTIVVLCSGYIGYRS